jgi:hypothetical protein
VGFVAMWVGGALIALAFVAGAILVLYGDKDRKD